MKETAVVEFGSAQLDEVEGRLWSLANHEINGHVANRCLNDYGHDSAALLVDAVACGALMYRHPIATSNTANGNMEQGNNLLNIVT